MNASSVKDRLKNLAIKDKTTMQNKLITYGLERAIYRLSISKYADKFTLKGGIFLYALFDKEYARATMDIDLLARHLNNNVEEMVKVFKEIFLIECDDAIKFDLNSLDVHMITEFKEYHGANVSIKGYLDRTEIPVSIDIGFGDIIYPNRVKMDFPVILDMEVPRIYAYSIYSVIAEKFEAIASLGLVNSRYKDFYDIYVLAINYNFEGTKLLTAIIETFNHRNTDLNDIVAFDDDFGMNMIHIDRWDSFIKKKKAMINIGFKETLDVLKKLLIPVVNAIHTEEDFDMTWNNDIMQWVEEQEI